MFCGKTQKKTSKEKNTIKISVNNNNRKKIESFSRLVKKKPVKDWSTFFQINSEVQNQTLKLKYTLFLKKK